MKGWSNLILGVARLFLKGGRRAIGFDLASIGELQWCRGIIESFASRHPKDLIYIFHHDATQDQFDALCPKLRGRVTHVPFGHIHRRCFRKLDLYVTTEEFNPGPPTVYTVTVFHSQGAKGVAFYLPHSDPLKVNDALFLYGTYQRESLYEHLEMWRRELPPHLSLYDIGYPKSDDLINGKFVREEILVEMGLDPKKRTILYAPAFNEGASMRECGIEILETLCALKEFNILAKLAIDCLRPTTDFYSTGGVDWFKTIGRLEGENTNFRLVRSLEADPAMAASDVMITCVSGISFEFLALERPVIYIDTPKFFSHYLRKLFPTQDTVSWADRMSVNGGREFGILVSHPHELPKAVEEVLSHPELYPRRKSELLRYLLYNPGEGTKAAVDQIARLLEQRVRSRRPGDQGWGLLLQMCGYVPVHTKILRKMRHTFLSKPRKLASRILNRFRSK